MRAQFIRSGIQGSDHCLLSSMMDVVRAMTTRQPDDRFPSNTHPRSASPYLFKPFGDDIKDIRPLNDAKQGNHYLLRPLKRDDFSYGFVELLSQLTDVEGLTESAFQMRFDSLQKQGNYFTVVVEDTVANKLVASGTVFIEEKFIHNAGKVGHIEDVVVDALARTHKLGILIVRTLKKIAFGQGCYKIILDCAEKNIGFYQKCGFEPREVEMVVYKSKM